MKDLQFNERKQHGLPDFPFQYYYINSDHPQYVMPLHWHSEFEIIKVLSGCFELYLDNKLIVLNSGECAIINCTATHRGTPKDCVYECIVFSISMLYKKSNDVIRKYLRPIAHRNVSIVVSPTKSTKEIIDSILSVAKEQKYLYELKIHSLLYELFMSFHTENSVINQESKQNQKQIEKIGELLHWIDKNYSENINLNMLSDIAGLNQKYLCRFFKEYTGRTPIDYINNLRIEAACYEMRHSGLSVTDAALECGFNSISYFTKAFKKYKKVTPTEYRSEKNEASI